MNIATAHLAETAELPPVTGFYQFVIASAGLYLRALDERLEAMVLIAATDRDLRGLADLSEYVALRVPKIPLPFLLSVRSSARKHLPNEAMYQMRWVRNTNHPEDAGDWKVTMPKQSATPTSLTFDDQPDTVLDLHSHGAMGAFFSGTDDGDEQGLRMYVVIGKVDSDTPEILCRVGVYGHFLNVPATDLFESIGIFVDKYGQPDEIHYEPLDELEDENELDITETESGLLIAHI